METTGRPVDVDGECCVFRGWTWMGMWCGSWMGNVCVRRWGYMGNGCVRGWGYMGNGGWTYWSNRGGNLELKQI